MLKAHRVGRPLDEAFESLNERMPSDDLKLLTMAILVARETGGDVTVVISQLVSTIRERKKLYDKVRTLTLQGRLQAYIMSAVPVLFAGFVRTFNPEYFQILLEDPLGNVCLAAACGLWCVGMFLLVKLSKVEL